MAGIPAIGFSPKQQIVFAMCSLCCGIYLCGTSWQSARQILVTFPLTESLPADVTFMIEPAVNVNTSDQEELQLLPAIGPVLADRILDYRRQHGPFSSVDELRRVRGIGPKTVQKLSHYLEFDD